MKKNYALKFNTPAEDSLVGWEQYSLPLGNGYFGASVFGRTDAERIQFATNVFANDKPRGGVSSFADIYLDFQHDGAENYERGLSLSEGFAYTRYALKDNSIESRAFLSYPDKAFVYRITAAEKISFSVRLVIPYLDSRTVEEGGRTGEVFVKDNTLTMKGSLPFRNLFYEGKLTVLSDGKVTAKKDGLYVENGRETTLFFVADTSYKLDEKVFLDGNRKAVGEDPHAAVEEGMQNALFLGYERLFARHQADYLSLMSRAELDLGGVEDGRTTDELLESNRQGNFEPYLEELYYQYGRHLLVSSSRKGTPPASLQGVWNAHDKSPWGSGFWHNINVQMNYWPAFTTNLAETFEAYADYNQAFRKQAEILASKWIEENVPENYKEGQGECGWTIGTAAYCYEIDGQSAHSGPGTGGLTTKLFWDYYDFTRDENILKNVTYPAIHGMAKFLTKCVRNYDGEYLSVFSASPEQIIGAWVPGKKI
ncbi:MAG: glycoside hydrolase N-terminal domain-containing protein, partial [Clostridia bacterium]|nr:glycoside hydrolase N-terminal domain-containing protein [Clostridia bacterium]